MANFPKTDYLKVIGAVLVGVIAVLGWQLSDAATTPFWWNFWKVAAVVCLVGWVVAWVILKGKDKANRD